MFAKLLKVTKYLDTVLARGLIKSKVYQLAIKICILETFIVTRNFKLILLNHFTIKKTQDSKRFPRTSYLLLFFLLVRNYS